MLPVEDSYGNAKRLAFCMEVIDRRNPVNVLDVDCGTGANLTRPLTLAFPGVRLVGIDRDDTSIAFARSQARLANLEFGDESLLQHVPSADFFIASEVVEHVQLPEVFLASLGERRATEGRMIVSLPNGYGPFERASFIDALLRVSEAFPALRRLKRMAVEQCLAQPGRLDTLAIIPQNNFFWTREIRDVFKRAELRVERYCSRTFLCGFRFDQLVHLLRIANWNARVGTNVPQALVSGWMFNPTPWWPASARGFERGPMGCRRSSVHERLSFGR